jgi:hypothetical protein
VVVVSSRLLGKQNDEDLVYMYLNFACFVSMYNYSNVFFLVLNLMSRLTNISCMS